MLDGVFVLNEGIVEFPPVRRLTREDVAAVVALIARRVARLRLRYADEVTFHLDTLPCIPDDASVILGLTSRGVPPELAALAVAITDRRHPRYDQITRDLLSSNPLGFARWFETRARLVAMPRMRHLVERRLYASVEEVPPYEWKTPLQTSIQILKRHRDVMFRDDPGAGPISMILTNLAAQAYEGETDLALALTNIVDRVPRFVSPTRPRVPNPADLAEDYADKWINNPVLEQKFWWWLTQVKADVAKPSTFHKLEGGDLCLGSPTRLLLIARESATLPRFVDRCVIPYLYGYSNFEKYRTMPFGELEHGGAGIRDDFASLFGVGGATAVAEFIRVTSMRRRQANKERGSLRRLGRCHHRRVNGLRKRLGRRWFRMWHVALRTRLLSADRKPSGDKWAADVENRRLLRQIAEAGSWVSESWPPTIGGSGR